MCPLRGHRRRREGGSKHSASVGAAMSAGASPMSPRAEHTLGNRPSGPQRAGPGQERCGGGEPAGGSKTSGWGRGQRPDVPKWPRGGFGGWQRPAGELPAASTASPRLGPGPPGLRPLPGHSLATRLPAMTHPSAAPLMSTAGTGQAARDGRWPGGRTKLCLAHLVSGGTHGRPQKPGCPCPGAPGDSSVGAPLQPHPRVASGATSCPSAYL